MLGDAAEASLFVAKAVVKFDGDASTLATAAERTYTRPPKK